MYFSSLQLAIYQFLQFQPCMFLTCLVQHTFGPLIDNTIDLMNDVCCLAFVCLEVAMLSILIVFAYILYAYEPI